MNLNQINIQITPTDVNSEWEGLKLAVIKPPYLSQTLDTWDNLNEMP